MIESVVISFFILKKKYLYYNKLYFCRKISKNKKMLVQFTVKNYKTFRKQAVLSLVASGYDKKTHEEDNVFQEKNIRLLRSAVVYGANASGKSKLIEALAFMRKIVYGSASDSQKGQIIPVESFFIESRN
ncbi:AAA family ATPase [Capnocytophaga canimorsus]|nr:AAA family ATPase [Capnocytophaga canimorsus]WGU68564.1 AAA family ATPase [Capnocytophaga canimorsus]